MKKIKTKKNKNKISESLYFLSNLNINYDHLFAR